MHFTLHERLPLKNNIDTEGFIPSNYWFLVYKGRVKGVKSLKHYDNNAMLSLLSSRIVLGIVCKLASVLFLAIFAFLSADDKTTRFNLLMCIMIQGIAAIHGYFIYQIRKCQYTSESGDSMYEHQKNEMEIDSLR